MKRLLVVSMLSLAMAGCAQSKGALSRGASYPPSPVAITPVPSVYDTVNQGMGGKAVAQTAIANPDDPHWAGRAPAPAAPGAVSPGSPESTGGPGPALATNTGAATAAPTVASGLPQSSAQPTGVAPAPTAPAGLVAMPPIVNEVPTSLTASSATPAPTALSAPGPGMPGLAPAPDSRTVSSGPIASDPGNIPLDSSSAGPKPSAALPSGVVVSAPASSMPAPLAGTPGPKNPVAKRTADPLLGPDPDLMPTMPEPPASGSPNKQAKAPAGTSLELVPAVAPASSPTPELNPAEPPAAVPGVSEKPAPTADPPISPDSSSAASKPADGGLAATDLKLEPAPSPEQALPAVAVRATARAPAADLADPLVVLTSSGDSEGPSQSRTASLKEAGRPVARVGDEIITRHELNTAVRETIERLPQLRAQLTQGGSEAQRAHDIDMLYRQVLTDLIDRSLLVQEAKRHIKDKTMLGKIYEDADRMFREQEIESLQRKYHVDTEAQVKEKLAEDGRSLEAMRLSNRQTQLSGAYLSSKIRDRLKVDLPELLKFYNEHVYEHEFDRPAQVTWRELVVEVAKNKDRADAKKKADALLERLRRGDDFARLARTESDGLTSSRNDGGLMHTTPGSYAVENINKALDSLPIGQVSEVIEGPDSFHILRVENRRPPGPASFEEILDTIKPMLERKRGQEEQAAFLKKLKSNAIITLYLNKTDPNKP
jgi:peptidyl-prolyl cis-trans isomerase SurA